MSHAAGRGGAAPRALLAAGALVMTLAACGDRAAPPLAEPVQFTLRGRWSDPMRLTWRCELENAPLGAASFARAVERAAAAWSATGVVGLRPAADGQPADVTLGFRAGHHGACTPFGPASDIAHAGPVASGTFVHFDLGRTWSEDGQSGHSVFATALHELGHVLGLGHSEAPAAVMGTAPLRPAALSPHDLAGLRTLYGGGPRGDDDLAIVAGGAVSTTLCAVAPRGLTGFGVFDSDGDGDDEVLVWRTDGPGHGSLLVFHFARGPLVDHTAGPFPGAVAPGARVGFVHGALGERYLVCTFASGRPVVRAFDGHGVPGLPVAPPADDVPARAMAPQRGDLDGDGRPEDVVAGVR